MSQTKQIVLTANKGYFPHVIALIKSYLAFNRDHTTFIIVHDVADPEDPSLKQIADEFVNCPSLKFDFICANKQTLLDWGSHPELVDNPVMWRLLIPEFPYTGRILYIDVDILFTGSIAELFTQEDILKGKSIGVCVDLKDYQAKFQRKNPYDDPYFPDIIRELPFGQTLDNAFFNAGVILIDVEKIRKSLDPEKNLWQYHFPEYFSKGKFEGLDQTFLNIVHFNDKAILSSKYNFFSLFLSETRFYVDLAGWKDYPKALAEGKVEPPMYPSILHFLTISPAKAWDSPQKDFREMYNFYAKQSTSEILAKPESYYLNMMVNYYDHYGYTPGLLDSSIYSKYLFNVTIEQVVKSVSPFARKWGVSPIFLNQFIYRARGLRKLLTKKKSGYVRRMAAVAEHAEKNFKSFEELALEDKKK
ncbi:hypothetical protein CKF54_05450 [Psittacicella hinzii]|uniref:Uncharacterized protein n=1 Tax=Psittacicella hinzii TaxID=2028575 RepID=A0A3A1Y7I5_9GAMM|nr:glycosyltransferase [Psittacicella hinzii]RIY32034.1 hypothetical protein CKF54_05450 [Psittacicella hinzii]